MSGKLWRLRRLCRMSINKPWNSLQPWRHPVEYGLGLRYLWRTCPTPGEFDAMREAAAR